MMMMDHRVSIVLLALIASLDVRGQFVEANSAFNVGFLGGLDSSGSGQGGFLTSTFGNTMDLAQGIPNIVNNAVQQVTKPLDGVVGSLLNPVGSTLSSLSGLTGGITGQLGAGLGLSLSSSDSQMGSAASQVSRNLAGAASSGSLNGLSLPTGLVGGLTTGLAAATGLNSLTNVATEATRALTNPGSLLGAASAGALASGARAAGAAQTAGAISSASHAAGAMSAASQAAGALGAMNGLSAGAGAGASSIMNGASNAAMINSIGNGIQNVQNSIASSAAASEALNSMGAISGQANLDSLGQLNRLNSMHNMAQYNHLQRRREAISSAASGALVGNSVAQSELIGGGSSSSLGRAAGAAAASLAGNSAVAGLEAAKLAGAASSAAALGSAAGLGQSLGAGALGASALGAGAGAGASAAALGTHLGLAEAAGAAGAAGALGALAPGSAAAAAALSGSPHLPGYLGGVSREAAALQQAGQQAAALGQAAATYGAVNNHLLPALVAPEQLIGGIAHQPGQAINEAVARGAIDSTARSLAASQALEAAALPIASANNGAQLAQASGALAAETALTEPLIENPLTPARQSLAIDAHRNAEAEAAIAGNDMVAHGLENSQSASLATNAYRQAKLASARDRVNIAGTIQNSARISDAAIATHDAATKAEDSLLGSELAVDSAATVLDSDAAYIPPVTSSMLRSLPYGRLGLRNILPRPLTYPSVLLPDVWLNGQPVNYRNLPFRMMPYGIGAEGLAAASVYGINRAGGAEATGVLAGIGSATSGPEAAAATAAASSGLFLEGQPILSNNGIYLNGLLIDPKYAYLRNINGVDGSSIMPVLANGQLEAQDEVAMANILTAQQQLGPGMLGTYNGFARLNTVPMLTGSVTDANLAPTTTVGTIYPIGSALVVEPRDSYFQDYIDNASSRQNFDERQQ